MEQRSTDGGWYWEKARRLPFPWEAASWNEWMTRWTFSMSVRPVLTCAGIRRAVRERASRLWPLAQ